MTRLHLLGGLELVVDGTEVARDRKPLLVLALLAIQPTRAMHREDVARLLWPEQDRSRAVASLRQARYTIRSWCDGCLLAEGESLRLSPDVGSDLFDLERALAAKNHARVVGLYGGPLLGSMSRGLTGQLASDVDALGTGLQTRVTSAYEEHLSDLCRCGEWQRAEELAVKLGELEPLDERAQTLVVQTLFACGRPSAAIAAFERYASLLRAELGDEPGPRLTTLAEKIRAEAPRQALDRRPAGPDAEQPQVGRLRRRTKVAAALSVLGLLSVLAFGRPRPPSAADLAFDGLLVMQLDEAVRARELRPTGGDTPVLMRLPRDFRANGFQRLADGRMVSFGRVEWGASRPPTAAIIGTEARYIFQRTDSLQSGVYDVSPSGHAALVIVEAEPESGEWRERLEAIPLAREGPARVLLRPRPRIVGAQWSPDGLRIAAVVQSAVDSLLILEHDGSVSHSVSSDELHTLGRPRWCPGGRFLFIRAQGFATADVRLLRVDTRTSNVDTFESPVDLPALVACSGRRGEALIVRGVEGDATYLFAVEAREPVSAARLARVDPTAGPYGWVPMTPPPVAEAVEVRPAAPIQMIWGERRRVQGHIRYSSQPADSSELEWSSGEPGIAHVADGMITATGPGTTWIRAQAAHLSDSVEVTVSGEVPPEFQIAEPFDPTFVERWILEGVEPAPVSVTDPHTGASRLSLQGDGMYPDEMVMRVPLDVTVGATIHIDFRIRLTRRNHQRIGICVKGSHGSASLPSENPGQRACVIYPSGELDKFRPDFGELVVGLPSRRVPLPMSAGDGEWHRLTMRITPGGELDVTIDDGDRVLARDRLRLEGHDNWHLAIQGWSREGSTEIRNLLVRRGIVR